MNIRRPFIVALVIIYFTSCGSKTHEFSEKDFDWIPYKGRDTLIFSSNTGDTDSLFIRNPKRYIEYSGDAFDITPQDSVEKFYIPYRFSFIDTTNGIKSPGEQTLIAMHRTVNNKTKIGFGIVTNDAFFYGLQYFNIKDLNKTVLTSLKTSLKEYNDILIIEPDTSNLKYSSRDHYVLRMYWSKSEGLVRFDKNHSVKYTLMNK